MSNNISQEPSTDGARARAVRHRRRVGSMAALVAVVLHGAVLWLLASTVGPRAPWRPPRTADAMVRPDPGPMTWVSVVAPPAVPPPATPRRQPERAPLHAPVVPADPPRPDRPAPAPRAARATPSTPRASPSALASDRSPVAATSSVPMAGMPATAQADASSPDAPSPGASPAPTTVPLQRTLRKEALRELSAGGRVWQDDPRLASKPPASTDSRLESGMSSAARGDCLRGEFRGGDMGLLSLPLMGLAAAQGRCRMP